MPAPAAAAPAPGAPRLITIDLDDTLWPCAPAIQAAEAALIAWLAEAANIVLMHHVYAALRAHALFQKNVDYILRDGQIIIVDEFTGRTMPEHRYDVALADAAMDHFRRHRNQVEPYADAAPVLARLRERHCLIAVTNGNAELAETPLGNAFHRALTAAEAGAKSSGPNGVRRRMLNAAGVIRCDARVARTPASPFSAINSGRYAFGSRFLMTLRFVSAVSGVRFRMESTAAVRPCSFPQLLGTMWWSSRSPCCGTLPVIQSRAPRRTSRLKMPL